MTLGGDGARTPLLRLRSRALATRRPPQCFPHPWTRRRTARAPPDRRVVRRRSPAPARRLQPLALRRARLSSGTGLGDGAFDRQGDQGTRRSGALGLRVGDTVPGVDATSSTPFIPARNASTTSPPSWQKSKVRVSSAQNWSVLHRCRFSPTRPATGFLSSVSTRSTRSRPGWRAANEQRDPAPRPG